MWGECGHEMLRGQSCCRIRGAGAQQLGVQGWSDQESCRDAALGRYREVFLLGWGEGGRAGGKGKSWVLCPWAGNGSSGEKHVGWKKPQGVTTTRV